MIHTLDPERTRELLENGRFGHLGCIVDDAPYVVPVNYAYDEGDIYLHSLPGRKIDAMRERSRVCLQVEELHGEYRWSSVQAFGDFEELQVEDDISRAEHLLFHRFPRLTPADAVRRYGRLVAETIYFRIRIDRLVGIAEE